MPPSARPKPWLPPISLVACALITLLASFVWHFVPFKVTGQAFLLIVILRAFRYWPPMIRWATSMPVPHRIVFGVLIGAMILGHYTLNGPRLLPLCRLGNLSLRARRRPGHLPRIHRHHGQRQQSPAARRATFPLHRPVQSPSTMLTTHAPARPSISPAPWRKSTTTHHADDPVRRSISCSWPSSFTLPRANRAPNLHASCSNITTSHRAARADPRAGRTDGCCA